MTLPQDHPMDAGKLREAICGIRRCGVSYGPRETILRYAMHVGVMDDIFAAAEAHLSALPQTKEVEVWRVEFAQDTGAGRWAPKTHTFSNEAEAREYAKGGVNYLRCQRVTGPHKQTVPA